MAQKDVATLNKIIADDLIYTHFLGAVASGYQETLIGAMEAGATVYTSVVPSEVVRRISAMPGADGVCRDQRQFRR